MSLTCLPKPKPLVLVDKVYISPTLNPNFSGECGNFNLCLEECVRKWRRHVIGLSKRGFDDLIRERRDMATLVRGMASLVRIVVISLL